MVLKKRPKISQQKNKRRNEVLIYGCFEMRERVLILTMNLGICLWEWDGIFVGNKYRHNYKLDEYKTEI